MTPVTPDTVFTLMVTTFAGTTAIVGVVVLVVLLILKELTISPANKVSRRRWQVLNIGIIPLLIAFVLIVIYRLVDILK